MRDDRDPRPDYPSEATGATPSDEDAAAEEDFRLLSTEEFDGALRALEAYEDSPDEWGPLDEQEAEADAIVATPLRDEQYEVLAPLVDSADEDAYAIPDEDEQAQVEHTDLAVDSARPYVASAPSGDEERVRAPRARSFRRRLRHQLGLLPLTLYLLALGAYLLARGQHVGDLPDLSTQALAAASVLVGAFTAVFHAVVTGRRERGLLFLGLWVLVTAGIIAGVIYGVDDNPAAAKWWPLVLWSLGLAMILVFIIERGHDSRLIYTGLVALAAGAAAYAVTTEWIAEGTLERTGDYWPLLIGVVGVGLLPLAVRRRPE